MLFSLHGNIRSIREESSAREIFEEYVARLQEKARDKERKREEEKVSEFLYYCTEHPLCLVNITVKELDFRISLFFI